MHVRAAPPAVLRTIMQLSPDFEVVGDLAVCRLSGRVSFEQASAMRCSAIHCARERGIQKLLLVTSDLALFRPPNLGDRYFRAEACAKSAAGQVCVAVVARPELIDPQKFGVTVARNYGMVTDVFTSEAEALTWLEGCKP